MQRAETYLFRTLSNIYDEHLFTSGEFLIALLKSTVWNFSYLVLIIPFFRLLSSYFFSLLKEREHYYVVFKDVFRTQSNIYDEALLRK